MGHSVEHVLRSNGFLECSFNSRNNQQFGTSQKKHILHSLKECLLVHNFATPIPTPSSYRAYLIFVQLFRLITLRLTHPRDLFSLSPSSIHIPLSTMKRVKLYQWICTGPLSKDFKESLKFSTNLSLFKIHVEILYTA